MARLAERLYNELENRPTTHDSDYYREKFAGLSPDELEMVRKYAQTDRMSATTVYRMECFLEGGEGRNPSPKQVKRIKNEYLLRRGRIGYYKETCKSVFQALLKKYPDRACLYQNFNDLYFAVVDGRREWEMAS